MFGSGCIDFGEAVMMEITGFRGRDDVEDVGRHRRYLDNVRQA